jgi:hypothetical protein
MSEMESRCGGGEYRGSGVGGELDVEKLRKSSAGGRSLRRRGEGRRPDLMGMGSRIEHRCSQIFGHPRKNLILNR